MSDLADLDTADIDNKALNPLVVGFNNLNMVRQIGLMIGLAASVAIGFSVVLWSQEPNFKPLYSNLSDIDAVEITAVLDQHKIPYKIDTGSGMLLVPADQVHNARLKMASAGYSAEQSIGYEILQKDPSFGTSQFMETARYHHSIEAELARTISAMDNVKSARVHLALPKRSVFVGDKRKPSASIFVEILPGRELEKSNIAAVIHLVASSVPDLNSKHVTVVDQHGNLLSENDGDTDIVMAAKQFEYNRKVEEDFSDRINEILTPILGKDNFKVQVSADIDYTKSEKTSESYNPDLPALRSERILDEERTGGGVLGGVPGALTNQPPAPGVAPQVGGAAAPVNDNGKESNRRSQATRNYELDRTISHTKQQFAKLMRLSVAVVVNYKTLSATSAAEEGDAADSEQQGEAVSRSPYSNEEINQLTLLVKDAIGFDPARGDSVSVVNQEFLATEKVVVEAQPVEYWQEPWFWEIVKQAAAGLMIVLLVLGVLRPFMKNLSTAGAESQGLQDMSDPEGLFNDELAEEELDEESITLSAGVESLLPGPDESYEQQLEAVRSMIADDPRRVAQVIKTWLSDG